MTIIGTSFTRILVEKKAAPKGKLNISNNVALKNVEKIELSIGASNQNAIKFSFEFTSKYEPGVGQIVIEGELLSIEKPEVIKDATEGWKKGKKLPKEMMASVLNNVLSKCNVEALVLSREINLPPPMQLPKVTMKK